jgi:hypothetical protein
MYGKGVPDFQTKALPGLSLHPRSGIRQSSVWSLLVEHAPKHLLGELMSFFVPSG